MATPFHFPVTAAQVGTYFVGQYYQVLQHQPELVHQFYSEASTMVRIDGTMREAATAMLQIHAVIMSLNYTGVEIKTAHSLESWNGGILVMVSGSVLIKNFSGRRQFVQTFFLAPQEKGYFVLNDIFHFIDDEPLHQHPVAYLSQSNVDSNLYASAAIREPVSNYVMDRETQAREFVSPADIKENGPVDTYSFSEEPLQHIPEAESILDGTFAESNGSLENSVDRVPDHLSAPVEEPVGEPQKRTYASILQVAKGQSATRSPPQSSVSKSTPLASEWNHEPEPPTQQSVASSTAVESSGAEAAEDFSALEDEGEIKSVYVRNLPSTVSAVEIEEEFKKFGRLKPDAVAIRNRKDIGVCYAFVEFEDINGVQNAIKASTVQIAGQQIFIEERRANRINAFRGGRRGRGRGGYGYPTEVPRGRFGARSFGSRNGYEGGNYDYNRLRGNGLYRPAPQQDRGFSSYQVSRSEQNQSE
ncbi:nuclear transport factor 2-like isoform X1 [Actinidia eriantha]|uniref:nuclear transport factor 2-like isoform X1 n=1 Tax=Actinidia eriantha TaxID=165200 RepID=UPI002584A8F7|nr:nuclear transport factor 2-like isoform X1 [Actinidia eriantha]